MFLCVLYLKPLSFLANHLPSLRKTVTLAFSVVHVFLNLYRFPPLNRPFADRLHTLGSYVCTVEPACKVRGFVQQKLTIQEGFCSLTLQPSIIIKDMVIWDLLELTLYPF